MSAQTLEHLADLLARACGTEYVGVWSCAFGKLDLRYGRTRQAIVNAAYVAWGEARFELQEGRTVREHDCTVLPLLSGRHDLVGLLVLPVALPRDAAALRYFDDLLRRITRHVMAPQAPPDPEMVAVPLELLARPGGIESLERDAYLALMLRFGWNVSLVASLLGISRLKLARRLKRVGLDRPNESTKARPRSASRPGDDPIDDAVRTLLWPRVTRCKPT